MGQDHKMGEGLNVAQLFPVGLPTAALAATVMDEHAERTARVKRVFFIEESSIEQLWTLWHPEF